MSDQVPPDRHYQTALSGLAATLVGHGIGRFSYVALLPAVIAAGWFDSAAAGYIGAANLVGYFAGALIANRLAQKIAPSTLIPASMALVAVSFLACATAAPFLWFVFWRFLAGAAGAVVMIVASPLILMRAPLKVRGRINGIVFTGIGLGVVLSGTLVPSMVSAAGVSAAWTGLAVAAAVLGIATLPVWFRFAAAERAVPPPSMALALPDGSRIVVLLLVAAYALDALGFIPHTLFWVDYIVRDLGYSLHQGGLFWAAFGIGAALGPFTTGLVADRVGFPTALVSAYALKAAAVGLPLVATGPLALILSSFGVGALTLGIVSLTSGFALQTVGPELHRKVWAWATLAYALVQAAGGPAMAALYDATSSYPLIFAIAAAAMLGGTLVLAFNIRLAAGRRRV